MKQEKYIGYLILEIAHTMWPSGLCREERGVIPASLPQRRRPPDLTAPYCST